MLKRKIESDDAGGASDSSLATRQGLESTDAVASRTRVNEEDEDEEGLER
jgi:hypothetical protein